MSHNYHMRTFDDFLADKDTGFLAEMGDPSALDRFRQQSRQQSAAEDSAAADKRIDNLRDQYRLSQRLDGLKPKPNQPLKRIA